MSLSRKAALCAFVIAVTGIASGCKDRTSPEGTVVAAEVAISKGDLKAFRATLMGQALEQFGNADGMSKIAKVLENQPLAFGKLVHLNTVETDASKQDTYTLPVQHKDANMTTDLLITRVVCEQWTHDGTNDDGVPHIHFARSCSIEKIRLK